MSEARLVRSLSPSGQQAVCTAVLFDFGGTLDAEGIPWKERFHRLFREEGVAFPSGEFDRAFYAADDALVGAIPSTLPFGETVARLATGVAHALGLQDPQLAARIAERFVVAARARLTANAALLARLSRRYRLGIVSNFYGNLAAVCDDLGLAPLLTVVVDSGQVGCSKPDPRIFREALGALRAEPAAAVFVGDSLKRDMAGARQIGMPHIWLAAETSRDAGPCCPNDPVVQTLDALPDLLL